MCIASLSAGRSVPLAADSLEALRRLCLFHSGAVQRADRVPSVQGAVRTVESMVTGMAFGVADPLTEPSCVGARLATCWQLPKPRACFLFSEFALLPSFAYSAPLRDALRPPHGLSSGSATKTSYCDPLRNEARSPITVFCCDHAVAGFH